MRSAALRSCRRLPRRTLGLVRAKTAVLRIGSAPRRGFALHTKLASYIDLPVGQGGTLHVDIAASATADVDITTAWIEEASIDVYGESRWHDCDLHETGLTVAVDEEEGTISIRRSRDWPSDSDSDDDAMEEPRFRIVALLPQVFNIMLTVAAGNLSVGQTVEGDVTLQTGCGDVRVRHVQGHTVALLAAAGRVAVVEAQGNIHARAGADIEASLLQGQSVLLEQGALGGAVGDPPRGVGVPERRGVLVGGLYAERAVVRSSGPVRIESSHGRLTIEAGDDAPVAVASINGCAAVSVAGGDVAVHFDALFPGSASTLRSERGAVAVSASEDVAAFVTAETGGAHGGGSVHGGGRTPEILSPRFEGSVGAGFAVGRLRKAEPRRRTGIFDRGSVGKIDLDGAREQRLLGFFGEGGGGGAEAAAAAA
ncbi:unnamed protein product, partial [Phaeothamnion confervicola]